jgi:hypothetical protein
MWSGFLMYVEVYNNIICNVLFDGHFMSMQGVLKRIGKMHVRPRNLLIAANTSFL